MGESALSIRSCWEKSAANDETVSGETLYTYVGNNPVNANDPMGLTDIFIGGFGDSSTGIVSKYRSNFKKRNPGRTTQYFEWDQQAQIVDYAKNASPPINLVGHSYGGSTASDVATILGNQNPPVTVDLLITADPVSYWLRPEKQPGNVTNWVDINAQPTNPNFSDTVAAFGGKWGNSPNGKASTFYNINANHENFSALLDTAPTGGKSALQTLLGSTGASGGYVLYPSKPNTNTMSRVYRK